MLVALSMIAVSTGVASGGRTSVDAGRVQRCAPNVLRPYLSTQGTATQSVTFLVLRNPERLTCSFSALVRFEVEQYGHRAPIAGNPLQARLSAMLAGTITGYAQPDVWWSNWCGSRHRLRMIGRVGRRTISARFRALPVCLAPHHRSTLMVGR